MWPLWTTMNWSCVDTDKMATNNTKVPLKGENYSTWKTQCQITLIKITCGALSVKQETWQANNDNNARPTFDTGLSHSFLIGVLDPLHCLSLNIQKDNCTLSYTKMWVKVCLSRLNKCQTRTREVTKQLVLKGEWPDIALKGRLLYKILTRI